MTSSGRGAPRIDPAQARNHERSSGVERMPPSVVDPKGGRSGSTGNRKVLVVSTVEGVDDPKELLGSQVGQADVIKVVVPVVSQGFLDWLANDEAAFSHAEAVAEHLADHLPGRTVAAVAGEADVELAIRDALATFPADEVVVAVGDGQDVAAPAAGGPTRRSIDGVPIRLVAVV